MKQNGENKPGRLKFWVKCSVPLTHLVMNQLTAWSKAHLSSAWEPFWKLPWSESLGDRDADSQGGRPSGLPSSLSSLHQGCRNPVGRGPPVGGCLAEEAETRPQSVFSAFGPHSPWGDRAGGCSMLVFRVSPKQAQR